MTRRYTAADFANARFAEHEDGRLATRDSGSLSNPWRATGDGFASDASMSTFGWVPVPSKPTITRSDAEDAYWHVADTDGIGHYLEFLECLGVKIIPDPEPTDEELLAGIIRNIDDWTSITSPELLAKYLNTAGVTPPNVKDN